MKQGKLDVVKQEMARVNIDILGISELKWMKMGEFNSDDHYIYYHGQESLRRNRAAIIINKSLKVLGCNLKNDRVISIRFQGKSFNITVIRVYALTSNAEEAEVEQFYEDLQDLLELTPPKKIPNQTWKQILRVSSFDVPASEHLQKALLGVGVMAWESVGGQTVYFGSTNQYES